MCGICGFTGNGDKAVLDRMVQTLIHRGPDEQGQWQGEGISLGMRRLSIIDIDSGHQPVFNEDRSLIAVFNGEIYNHSHLRNVLEAKGHRFYTHHSDSEVIVHLYEEYGLDFPSHLNGMFAIALWDNNNQRLVLVRDHAGIKPLYFAPLNNTLIFGSEPKALLAHPGVSHEPNLKAIHHYFSLKNIPAPLSAFDSIYQLRAGEMAMLERGELKKRQWWKMDYSQPPVESAEAAARGIRELLEDSVRLQMRSDAPIAAYLSGGMDSSAVVALMSELSPNPIKTFTLVYEDKFENKTSDRKFAHEVSRRYGTEHHEQFITYRDIPEHIDAILDSFDEPFSGVISTYFLTEAIAKHAKVALSGDGADELFGSYLPHRLAQPLNRLKTLGADGVKPDDLVPFENQLDFLQATLGRGDEAARRMGQYISDDARNRSIYTPLMRDAVHDACTEALVRQAFSQCNTSDPLNRALYVDSQTLLPDQVLPFVDRLSMAHSVEVRPPFLDPRLMQFSARIPGHMKIRDHSVKDILKKAIMNLLPNDLIHRPKEGFIMPINEWIIESLRGFVEALLAPDRLKKHGLLNPSAVSIMLKEHYSGNAHHGNRLWNLMMFQLWWEKHFA